MEIPVRRARNQFLEDRWDGYSKLQDEYPKLYRLARNPCSSVRDNYTQHGFRNITRNMGLREYIRREKSTLMNQLTGITLNQGEKNTPIWLWNSGGQFSIRSCYKTLTAGGRKIMKQE